MNCVSSIIESGRCVKCGMCSSVCKVNAINSLYNENTGFFDFLIDQQQCTKCGVCATICPRNDVSLHKSYSNTNVIGNFMDLYLAHSNDERIRHSATSGGMVNAVTHFLLENCLVDAILMVRMNSSSPNQCESVIITNDNLHQLQEKPRDFSSRYVSIPTLLNFNKLLKYNKVAVVGPPCQMKGLSNWEKKFKRSIFKIGIACSGGMSYKATEKLFQLHGIQNGTIYYRGDGWPGYNQVVGDSNSINQMHLKSDFNVLFSSQIFKNNACFYCNDQFAEESDISFFDFWDSKELNTEKEGNSGVIIRSERVKKIFEMMAEDNKITVVSKLNSQEVIKSQAYPLRLKKRKKTSLRLMIYLNHINKKFINQKYKIMDLNAFKKETQKYYKIIRTCPEIIITSERNNDEQKW